jgi:hypothetical protein
MSVIQVADAGDLGKLPSPGCDIGRVGGQEAGRFRQAIALGLVIRGVAAQGKVLIRHELLPLVSV